MKRMPSKAWFIPISDHEHSSTAATSSHSTYDCNLTPQNEARMSASIKIPPFWPKDPELWFHQVDAQFAAKDIVNSTLKYNHVVAALSPEIAGLVRELIKAPPINDPYKVLKDTIIERTGPTRQQQIHELLRPQSVGDRRPSIMLQEMKQQMGQDTGDMLRELFRKRLPKNISLMLSAFPNDTIDELAKKADNMYDEMDIQPPKMHAFLDSNTSDFNAISKPSDPELCWYHNRFGEKARTCRPPCKRQPGIQSEQSTENKTAGRL